MPANHEMVTGTLGIAQIRHGWAVDSSFAGSQNSERLLMRRDLAVNVIKWSNRGHFFLIASLAMDVSDDADRCAGSAHFRSS